jgi:hypothetical protein
MNAIILKGAALRQPPLPQSGPQAKTIAHPCSKMNEALSLSILNGVVHKQIGTLSSPFHLCYLCDSQSQSVQIVDSYNRIRCSVYTTVRTNVADAVLLI